MFAFDRIREADPLALGPRLPHALAITCVVTLGLVGFIAMQPGSGPRPLEHKRSLTLPIRDAVPAQSIPTHARTGRARRSRNGKSFSLAIPIDQTGPVFPPRLPPHHTMTITGADYAVDPEAAPFGASPIRFADDYIYMALQGSTQWDALSHGWYGDTLYNGVPQTAIRSGEAGGATKLGIENVKTSFVGRGVLIDVVRYKGGPLPALATRSHGRISRVRSRRRRRRSVPATSSSSAPACSSSGTSSMRRVGPCSSPAR